MRDPELEAWYRSEDPGLRAWYRGAFPRDDRTYLTLARCAEVMGRTEDEILRLVRRRVLHAMLEDGEVVVEPAILAGAV